MLVHEAIADALVERLAGAVDVLEVGPAERLGIDVPAVIEAEAHERVTPATPSDAAATGDRRPGPTRRCPTGPASARRRVVADLPDDSAVLHEEVFGPLLTVERVRERRRRLRPSSTSAPFALTGGLFSRNPDVVEHVIAHDARSATSTSTGRSPARWSAASPSAATACRARARKAGGPGYLLQFVEPRVVTENTMRHGLVV